jgi:hypothetical protein
MVQPHTTWINAASSVIVVTKVSASTVYAVVITDGAERDVKSFRIMDFIKEYKQIAYNTTAAAQKMLLSNIIPCTSSAKKELKELIMKNQENINPIIVVTRTAEFVGRFVDTKTASLIASDNDLIITKAEDFTEFSKSQLVSQLPADSQPTEVQLKNITKAQLSQQLFDYYIAKELTITMSEETKTSTKKAKAPKADSNMSKIIARFENGEVLTAEALAEEYGSTKASIASIFSNIQSEKYMKDRPTVELVSGNIDGIRSYIIATKADTVTFDARKSPAAKADGGPRKKGLKTIIRELLIEGPKTMEELMEATKADKKLVSDCLAYIKNPKYAGKEGALNIVRDAETKAYSVSAEETTED